MERTRTYKGVTSREMAYAVTSLPPEKAGPARLLSLWRGHFAIDLLLPGVGLDKGGDL